MIRRCDSSMRECQEKELEHRCGLVAESPVESGAENDQFRVADLPKLLAILLITFYRVCISPLTGPHCRFIPTCSEYALTSFRRYGFIKGLLLTVKRISKCHPWHPGGYDPVP